MPRAATAWITVYDELRRQISSLELAPGAKLSEAELAKEFGISATPVRDALGRLAQEGLVLVDRRGYQVAPLTVADIGDICDLRFVLEFGAVRLVMDRAKTDDLSELRELSRRTGESGLTPDEVIQRNRAFHIGLAQAAGSGRLVNALERVLAESTRFFRLGLTALTEDDMQLSHDRLLDAIESHDMVAAEAICKHEAFGTGERVLKLLLRSSQRSEAAFLSATGKPVAAQH